LNRGCFEAVLMKNILRTLGVKKTQGILGVKECQNNRHTLKKLASVQTRTPNADGNIKKT
jgi:hypothetical protein